ncbi:NAD(P)-dependent oxidoreductase [Cesiribacter sp. SM1]|uniref:NAD-dependent epimerase/dehydratase family protein n=1 Tax=Cesiribacter sp. SM1 TaxID=2861196 RepID=UPI001CD392B6|nr:SDR family oxidoreductase [Cesiribacter sp. SM1]
MNILITGGAGYIGNSLMKHLAQQTDVEKIIVYDNLSRGSFNIFCGPRIKGAEKVSFVHGELLDSRKLRKSLDGVDVVYHLAAKVTTPFANTDGHMHEQVNHWGTAELVYAIEESKVKRFIYTSSTSVYGSSAEEIQEQTTPNPSTLYGISKMRGEEHVQRLQQKIDTYILRLGNVYGYNRNMRFDAVINRFMFDAHYKGRLKIDGNGSQYRAFLHIDRLAPLLSRLRKAVVPSGTYAVVDRNLQVLDLVDAIKELYPELEFIFTNQHLQLPQLRVNPNSALLNYIKPDSIKPLTEELLEFRDHFSF